MKYKEIENLTLEEIEMYNSYLTHDSFSNKMRNYYLLRRWLKIVDDLNELKKLSDNEMNSYRILVENYNRNKNNEVVIKRMLDDGIIILMQFNNWLKEDKITKDKILMYIEEKENMLRKLIKNKRIYRRLIKLYNEKLEKKHKD